VLLLTVRAGEGVLLTVRAGEGGGVEGSRWILKDATCLRSENVFRKKVPGKKKYVREKRNHKLPGRTVWVVRTGDAVRKKSSGFAPIATRLALCICNFWSPTISTYFPTAFGAPWYRLSTDGIIPYHLIVSNSYWNMKAKDFVCVSGCDAGQAFNDGVCQDCPVDTYQDESAYTGACKSCPANAVSPAGSTTADACLCNIGYGSYATCTTCDDETNHYKAALVVCIAIVRLGIFTMSALIVVQRACKVQTKKLSAMQRRVVTVV